MIHSFPQKISHERLERQTLDLIASFMKKIVFQRKDSESDISSCQIDYIRVYRPQAIFRGFPFMNKFVYDKETFSTVSCDFIQFDVGAKLFCSAKNGMNRLTKLKTSWKKKLLFYESHLLAMIADSTEIPFFDNLEKKVVRNLKLQPRDHLNTLWC